MLLIIPFETFIDMQEQDDVATLGREQSAKDNYVIRNWPIAADYAVGSDADDVEK